MTPALLESVGVNPNGSQSEQTAVANEQLQYAFQQGVEYAQRQLAQQQVQMTGAAREQRTIDLKTENEEREAMLRERIDALQKREYRAPVKALACKEEREAALSCFREVRGATAGEIVTKCQQVTDDLERCAILVREAAMSKIVAGSLKSD